ncbi:tectonin domain-containing protein [Halalkalibaculum roseum]|uniref:tectonin domain-containing protein n=1 Tax=Halalkalibaculum roseum TaxID=2709311 RepID=UPI002012D3C1|nr:tectonin domain-containing protein [Halalkalibaculum roseum]
MIKTMFTSRKKTTLTSLLVTLFFVFSGTFSGTAFAQWENLPGKAKEIAAGGDSTASVWVLGENNSAYKWNENSFSWEDFGGKGDLIAVTNQGRPWVVNNKQIYRLRGRTWQSMPGKATAIAAGGGTVWVLGENKTAFKWNDEAFSWEEFGGNADLIAVDSNGIPWVVNNKQIYRLRGRNWQSMPGKATAIAAGGGTVWVIGENGQVYQWNDQAFEWMNKGGKASKIAVTPQGVPWVLQDGGTQIYRLRGTM